MFCLKHTFSSSRADICLVKEPTRILEVAIAADYCKARVWIQNKFTTRGGSCSDKTRGNLAHDNLPTGKQTHVKAEAKMPGPNLDKVLAGPQTESPLTVVAHERNTNDMHGHTFFFKHKITEFSLRRSRRATL